MRPLGYNVGLLGKKHIGPPAAYPFDDVGKIPSRKDGNAQALELAQSYVRKSKQESKRFCLVVAAHDGHHPYTTGDPSQYQQDQLQISKDAIGTPEYRRVLTEHLAEVTNLDKLLGKLREMLAEEKVAENTLVLFCSEQGNSFPFSKWSCFDDGLASGMVACLPGVIPAGGNCDSMMWLSDVAPTLIEAAGGTAKDDDFDGRTQWANWLGASHRVHEYAYGAFTNCHIVDNRERVYPIRSIRNDRYTLIWSPKAAQDVTSNLTLSKARQVLDSGEPPENDDVASSWVRVAKETDAPEDDALVQRFFHRPEWALYDRNGDPEELHNLIEDSDHASITDELKRELQTWLERWNDSDPIATEKGFLEE